MPRFTPDFLDELKSRLRPSDVIGRSVKLKKQGNEWAGLSPFTKEKTPSFFVNDQKGFFHCFSSGKHGDIIGFLQETQNLSFMEAVTVLAADAGLELPQDNPAEARREETNKGLVAACEAAADWFALMLTRPQGRKAVEYIRTRELTRAQVDEFRIGYAPSERSGLKDYLVNKGFHEDVLAEAGLIIKPDDGGAGYDKFRDRLMFPILSQRGQVIAFGGRALNPDAKAKYMNSPETPLFHKGSVLYRYAEARRASAEDKEPVIVCEGYMDVIALWGAGIRRAVAPLGTALTENQLAMLWRAVDEPVLCFDGDGAGTRAAYRSIERALPMLKPGKSLSFAFLPQGQDPDDLLRDKGRAALDEVIAAVNPLVDVLWRREEESHDLTTPERRASFKASLRNLVKTIADRDVRDFYGKELAQRLDERYGVRQTPYRGGSAAGQKFWQGGNGSWRGDTGNRGWRGRAGGYRRPAPPARVSPQLRALQGRSRVQSAWRREATILLVLVSHPDLMNRREPELLSLDLADPTLALLLADILSCLSTDDALDSAGLRRHLSSKATGKTLEQLLNDRALNSQTFLQADAQIDEVDWGFDSAMSHHAFETSLKEELARSASRIFQDSGEFGGDDVVSDSPSPEGPEDQSSAPASDSYWKATGAAREEVINRNRAQSKSDIGQGAKEDQLESALERMKASVSKSGRNNSSG